MSSSRKPPVDRTIDILDRHLTGDFIVFPMAERQCTAGEVEAVASRLGMSFPPDVVAHLCGTFPGIYVEAKEEIWPRPEAFEIGPFWSFLYGVHTYTASKESEEWMRMESAALEFRDETGLDAVPVLKVIGDADLYCLDATGGIVRFDHELNRLEPVELDFFGLFEREIAELVERTAMKKGER